MKSLPGHAIAVLHASVSVPEPVQAIPPNIGAGLVQVLVLVRMPPVHVLEQPLQVLQLAHMPSTESNVFINDKWIWWLRIRIRKWNPDPIRIRIRKEVWIWIRKWTLSNYVYFGHSGPKHSLLDLFHVSHGRIWVFHSYEQKWKPPGPGKKQYWKVAFKMQKVWNVGIL